MNRAQASVVARLGAIAATAALAWSSVLISAVTQEPEATGIRIAVVGDSLTAGGGRLLSQGLTESTWVTYAQGNGVIFAGGWAKGGSTIQAQAAHVHPLRDIDVLVIMSGTNNVRKGLSLDQSKASYTAVVETIHPRRVLIAAIPPYDRAPTKAGEYLVSLERFTDEQGWKFTDPWAFLRDDMLFKTGSTRDGIHPTLGGYRQLGLNLRNAITTAASSLPST